MALLVDDVQGVRSLGESDREPLPPLLDEAAQDSIANLARLDDELVLVLSTFRLIPDSENVWRRIQEHAGTTSRQDAAGGRE